MRRGVTDVLSMMSVLCTSSRQMSARDPDYQKSASC
jgi:hypothetical protein